MRIEFRPTPYTKFAIKQILNKQGNGKFLKHMNDYRIPADMALPQVVVFSFPRESMTVNYRKGAILPDNIQLTLGKKMNSTACIQFILNDEKIEIIGKVVEE